MATRTGFSTWMKRRGAGSVDDAGLIDRRDERRRAAVHDRHFRTIDFDDGVVDAQAAQGGKHMLGGRDHRTVAVAENGGEFGGDHRAEIGANFAIACRRVPVRKNTMPVSASAGCNVKVTGNPE